ncbi:uncharacterized protein [Battus philenor]|uniref:uncharacterized protein n=1 Tax=Battus philenor TaxID=42288 RepID=UPI0035CEBA20
MEESVGSTIEKIKLQEQSNEEKLKEKRELESTVAALNRNIQEALSFIEISERNQIELARKNGKLRCQLELYKIRRDALMAQIEVSKKDIEELKRKTDEAISNVWALRSSICSAIQDASDNYDIRALLTKPLATVPIPKAINTPVRADSVIEQKLKEALKRREDAIAERERLLREPDTSEEFVRIQNALKYSLEKIAFLRNNKKF